jgi:hypothetical protein
MSLLLPHERQMRTASNPNPNPPVANYGQQQMPQGQVYQGQTMAGFGPRQVGQGGQRVGQPGEY